MKPRKSFLLRLDPQLHELLERWAAQDLRSVNAQIEWLLKQAVEKHYRKELPPENTGDNQASGGREPPV